MLETIKIKLLKLLLNNIFKYNKQDCREKFLETTIDDLTYLLNN
jgi:DNA topoisomerase VI subunit A